MIELTVLCENSVYSHLGPLAEHGWSVYVHTSEGDFLFDTGLGLSLKNNLSYFKKDLTQIKGIILSHHHIDHTGGLKDALLLSGGTKVYSHPDLFKESFYLGKEKEFIGVPYEKEFLESLGASWDFSKDFREIAPRMYLSGEIPRESSFEKGDPKQVLFEDEKAYQDPLFDDQSLIFTTKKGLVILLGCAHAGLINILEYVTKKTGEKRIYAILGGTHLGFVPLSQREASIQKLQTYEIEHLGVSHCTGPDTGHELARIFGDRFFTCSVGTRFLVEE